MAAGLSIAPDKIDLLRQRLNEIARRKLRRRICSRRCASTPKSAWTKSPWNPSPNWKSLKPTGQGNPAVQFCARNLSHQRPLQRMGAQKQHVKMWVTDGMVTHECGLVEWR